MKKILALFVSTILTVTLAIGSTVSYVASEYIAPDTYTDPVALTFVNGQSGTGSASVVSLGDDRWEPGYTAVMVLNIRDKDPDDTIPVNFQLTMSKSPTETLPPLADVIDVYWFPGTSSVQRGQLAQAVSVGTLAELLNGQGSPMHGTFPADEDIYTITLVFKMREDAGNEYMNQTTPEFNISISANP